MAVVSRSDCDFAGTERRVRRRRPRQEEGRRRKRRRDCHVAVAASWQVAPLQLQMEQQGECGLIIVEEGSHNGSIVVFDFVSSSSSSSSSSVIS